MKVCSPDGQTWRVTRRWVPWRRRLKGFWAEFFGAGGLGSPDDPLGLVLFVVGLLLAVPALVLAIAGTVELLAVLLVFPFGLLARAVFGQHWVIEARRGFRIWRQEAVGDWQASGLRIHHVAAAIERGEIPRQNVDVDVDRAELEG